MSLIQDKILKKTKEGEKTDLKCCNSLPKKNKIREALHAREISIHIPDELMVMFSEEDGETLLEVKKYFLRK